MHHQVQPLPFRTVHLADTALQLHERAVKAYRAATRGVKSPPAELRKARALSQLPTALERLMHQILRMRLLNASIADLREIPLAIDALLDDLERDPSAARLTALLREARTREHASDMAEFEALTNATSAVELRRLAEARRAAASLNLEVANEADREARRMEAHV